jgi:hypothetical protein
VILHRNSIIFRHGRKPGLKRYSFDGGADLC